MRYYFHMIGCNASKKVACSIVKMIILDEMPSIVKKAHFSLTLPWQIFDDFFKMQRRFYLKRMYIIFFANESISSAVIIFTIKKAPFLLALQPII